MDVHFHVKRTDYDSRTAQETEVEVAVASTYLAGRQCAEKDEEQFRTPSADRFIWHSYFCVSCGMAHS